MQVRWFRRRLPPISGVRSGECAKYVDDREQDAEAESQKDKTVCFLEYCVKYI